MKCRCLANLKYTTETVFHHAVSHIEPMRRLDLGRIVPSYRHALHKEIEGWKGFRKALRKKDAEAFDSMMNACRMLSSAGSMATGPILLEAMFMSILLNQEKALTEIKEKLDRLENQLNHP